MKQWPHSFWYRNGLSLVLFALAVVFIGAQAYTGWLEYLDFLSEKGVAPVSFGEYLGTGHFIETLFENWESEFFQMGAYVILTIFLRQQGSSESKDLDKYEEVDRPPKPHKNAPWPVKRGGWILALYKHSLSIALLLLFVVSFTLHWYGSWRHYNLEQALDGKAGETFTEYLGNHRLWFESFQNWQSEFVAIFSLILLSIYLRQIGSPQSKPVDAATAETGE